MTLAQILLQAPPNMVDVQVLLEANKDTIMVMAGIITSLTTALGFLGRHVLSMYKNREDEARKREDKSHEREAELRKVIEEQKIELRLLKK